jgi:NO-binding membrane sensor protein with MHYT domain
MSTIILIFFRGFTFFVRMVHYTGLSLNPRMSYDICIVISSNIIGVLLQSTSIILVSPKRRLDLNGSVCIQITLHIAVTDQTKGFF